MAKWIEARRVANKFKLSVSTTQRQDAVDIEKQIFLASQNTQVKK